MDAALLKDIIEIETPVVERDGFGGQVTVWKRAWRGKARVEFASGSRVLQNSEVVNTRTNRVRVRYKPFFTEKDRLLIDGQYYRVVSMNRDKRDMSTVFMVELINE